MQIQTIEELLHLPDASYSNYVIQLLKKHNCLSLFDRLDDMLIKAVDKQAIDISRICTINRAVFEKYASNRQRSVLLANNFNTSIAAAIHSNEISTAKAIFAEGIDFCSRHQQYLAGKSISKNFLQLFSSKHIALDEIQSYLAKISRFYQKLGKHEDAIETLCTAAVNFAETSAYQAGYRAISDAQEISQKHNLIHSQLIVLETQGIVALLENDVPCADAEFTKCFSINQKLGTPPSFRLRANAAFVKMRMKDYLTAKEIYLTLVNDALGIEDYFRVAQIRTNLLICYRELGDTASLIHLQPLLRENLHDCNPETRTEAWLSLAKSYFRTQNHQQAIECLNEACTDIQHQIDRYQRLHYRRGIREKYVNRLEGLLNEIEDSGPSNNVLNALVLCSSNGLVDWLTLFDWIDTVLQSGEIPDAKKEELLNKKEAVIRHGAPFSQGFREKYDDPFETINWDAQTPEQQFQVQQFDLSRPWSEFNELTSELCEAYDIHLPFKNAAFNHVVATITKRLSSGVAFLFSSVNDEACLLTLVVNDRYYRFSLSRTSSFEYFKSLYLYQRREISRNDFIKRQMELETSLSPTGLKILSILESCNFSELVYIPDYLSEGLPIFSSIIRSDILRKRIKQGALKFRTTPALKEGKPNLNSRNSILFVFNSEDNLKLAQAEKTNITDVFGDQSFSEIDLRLTNIDFDNSPANISSILHLASHSMPANNFTDPLFVSTSNELGKNGIDLESIQRASSNLQFSLVVLNGCNTGTTSERNHYKTFTTNERVGLSSVFLLNRQCTVVGTQWNEAEIVGYIFSSLFYTRLQNQHDIAQTFALALTDLYELNREAAISLLNRIPDEELRHKHSTNLQHANAQYPFRSTYVLGMFQCHSLLM
ncbi:CHAT domain-containing protein [Sideroxydans sp. CL21]|uniref:CHAT domain-containing tetratricopeptide repeat protein n=1 Tax=Sideroxydans sp. CL21 TaxID=2600596 RepID=UPI0012A9B8A6|nr:CHAT domain-containing protein [Sideroxydans sp. CL21]VVC84997.1 hypothetical protein [Sideroxydans sp. CL21]